MKSALVLLLVFSSNLFAEEMLIPTQKFQISASNVEEKIELAIKYPESTLKRFQPAGAKITNKRVSNNNISFNATKSVLMISKTVHVNGILNTEQNNRLCQKNESGYKLTLELDGSDMLITDNIDRMEANLCVSSVSKSMADIRVSSKVILGNNYSSAMGSIAADMIKLQINPLINALTEEIKAMK